MVNTAKLLCFAVALTVFAASSSEAALFYKRHHHAVEHQSDRGYNYMPESNNAPDHEEHCYVPRPFTITCDR